MAAPGNTANGVLLFMPPNSAGIIHQDQGVSGAISQNPEMMQCGPQQFTVMNPGNQPLGSMYPGSPAEQVAQLRKVGMMEIFLKAQPKTLGAIQILIGLIHIGFGGVSTIFIKYIYVSGIVGYPFWGGIFFIISGSLSVAAENRGNICLVRSSRGVNRTSALFSAIGIILFLTELIFNASHYDHKDEEYHWLNAGKGITVMLLLLSILEFSIAVSTSYFASQAICYTPNTAMLFRPYAANENFGVPAAPMPPPPPYTNEAYDPKEETEQWAS
ncbi:membrane-spanning 4-domains subfamily A member 15-like isoform X1 [Chrysemys picta bellii]|uniref:membrane-spanning 4-domains subfamily A member 15-like isoform X1 n=1 Tax=Chrysemys picta bellii TaxID=8478 RepID=UPI000CE640BA|nr:membrane-spanning 4-domains subfamily A member 15-like isoform X1 [Chrysemys picta bellii]